MSSSSTPDMPLPLAILAARVARRLAGFQTPAVNHLHAARVWLSGPRGQRLEVAYDDYRRERASVRGLYPAGAVTDDLPNHRITVAVARGPQVIAHEITRRLLPAYLSDLAVAQQRIADRRHDDQSRARMAERLLTIAPGGRCSEYENETSLTWYSDHISLKLRLSGDGQLAFAELGWMPPTLTTRIVQAVGAFINSTPTPEEGRT